MSRKKKEKKKEAAVIFNVLFRGRCVRTRQGLPRITADLLRSGHRVAPKQKLKGSRS